MAREKKEKPPKKEKAPKVKKEKAPKKEKEQQEETLLQKLMRQAKIKGAEEEGPEEAAESGEQEEQEGAGRHKRKLILLIAAAVLVLAAAAVLVIFVILPRFSGEEPPAESSPPPEESEPVLYDLPASYEVGEETVKAVAPLLPDGVQAEKDVRVCYTYTGMTDAGAEASSYVSALRGEKFSVVDGSFVRTEEPDFETAEGTVLLAKNMEKKAASDAGTDQNADAGADAGKNTDADAGKNTDADAGKNTDADAGKNTDADAGKNTDADAGKNTDAGTDTGSGSGADASASPAPEEEQKDMVLTVELTWAPGTLRVVCDQAEGTVTGSTMPENGMTPGAAMSMWEAEEFLRGLEPSVLGLSGSSMEDYHIYAVDGAVLVDGQPCMRLNIYSREEGQSNEVAGIYLMSRDGQHLYLLNEKTRSVEEVPLP